MIILIASSHRVHLPFPSMLMAYTQKVKVIIEVELIDPEQITDSHPLAWYRPNSDTEAEIEKTHNQALLAALRSDPINYKDFIKTIIVGSIEGLEINREVTGLAKIGCPYTASIAILRSLFPQLPKASQQYFQRASQEGWLSEGIELIFNTIQAKPLNLTVEYS